MPRTPYDRYEYPNEGDENWNANPGPEDIWAKQEIEITGSVSSFSDLPEPDAQAVTDDGQRRRYFVEDRNIVYLDTGSEWRAIAGHGTSTDPVPEAHFNSAQVKTAPTADTDVVRYAEIENIQPGDHDHSGDTLNPDAVYSNTTDADLLTHSTTIDSDHTIPDGKGSVIAGPLEGTGEISGSGALAGVWDVMNIAVWESDTTANRPSSPTTGQRFFDEDLGQPIWYDGTDWVDAQGSVV